MDFKTTASPNSHVPNTQWGAASWNVKFGAEKSLLKAMQGGRWLMPWKALALKAINLFFFLLIIFIFKIYLIDNLETVHIFGYTPISSLAFPNLQ